MSPLIGRRITGTRTTWPYWVQAEGLTIHLLGGSFGQGPRTIGVAKEPGHFAPWLEEAVGERTLHATDTNGQFKLMTRHTHFGSLSDATPSYSMG